MKFCSAPWDTISINPVGEVRACLCGAWNSAGVLGNLLTMDMEQIMLSPNSRSLRDSVVDQTFSRCNSICPVIWQLPEINSVPRVDQYQLPTTILLAIDQRCNLRCASCRATNVFNDLVDPVAARILDRMVEAYRVQDAPVTLQMDGAGDLFASRTYREFMARADLPDCFRYHIITNGNLVMKNQSLLVGLRDRMVSVDVSLDAATAGTYTAVRGGRFDLVLQGIEWMLAQGLRVNISFVVQQQNHREMLACWHRVSAMGCHSINFQGIIRWPHMSDAWWADNRLEHNDSVDTALLCEQLRELDQAPRQVDFTGGGGLCPVHINGTLRQWIQQRPI